LWLRLRRAMESVVRLSSSVSGIKLLGFVIDAG
jgi:hypothetical protein